jgi:PhnB protein
MAKRSMTDELDRAVEQILRTRDSGLPPGGAGMAPLVRLAVRLRGLPGEEFRTRLKSELVREVKKTARVTGERGVIRAVTPYLVMEGVEEFLEFVRRAFGAKVLLRTTGSAGGLHTELRIGDSRVMAGGGPGFRTQPAALHLYVPDADAVYRRAIQAGASSMYAPMDQPYGDREAGVKDACGNHWYIATHKGANHVPEGMNTVTPCLHPRGAAQLLEFLKQALGAEEEVCEKTPEGAIVHARIRLGKSVVEMGEAHGEWQPMPAMFNLLVDDAEALYARALAAGAESLEPPADQPYGARRAAVKDPAGNAWYFSSPLPGKARK